MRSPQQASALPLGTAHLFEHVAPAQRSPPDRNAQLHSRAAVRLRLWSKKSRNKECWCRRTKSLPLSGVRGRGLLRTAGKGLKLMLSHILAEEAFTQRP